MSQKSLTAFLKQVAADETLKKEFTQFASEHGFDLSELSDEDLDTVAGGIMKNKHDTAKNAISSMDRGGTIESSS